MDTRQIEYLLMIEQEGNITRAANRLHLTQPALNQQLLRLEGELGIKLFIRNRTSLEPTEAGRVYLEAARRMLMIKQDTYRQLAEIAGKERSTLSVAFTPGRESRMFASVYPSFHNLYPDCVLRPVEGSVAEQIRMLRRGSVDMGLIAVQDMEENDITLIPLFEEELLLAVPAFDEKYAHAEGDLSLLDHAPFVMMPCGTTLRSFSELALEKSGIHPNVLFETAYHDTVLQMVSSGVSCAMIPSYYRREENQGIRWIQMPEHPRWTLYAAVRSGAYLPKELKSFIALLKNEL